MKNASHLLAALNEPVFELDLEGQVIAATPAAISLSGRDELEPNFAIVDIFALNVQTRFAQAFRRVAEGKVAAARVEITTIADTRLQFERPMEAKLVSVNGVNGKPTSVGLWLRDLSLEKASEAAANVQGTHLLDLVENVTDACVIERSDGAVEMLNDAFCALFMVKEASQSLVGTSCAELFSSASKVTVKRIGPLYFPLDLDMVQGARDELFFELVTGEKVTQTTLAVDGETGIAGRLHLFHLVAARDAIVTDVNADKPLASTVATQMSLIEKIARELAIALEGAASAVMRGEQLELPSQVLNHFRRVEQATLSAFDSVAGLLDFARIEGAPIALEPMAFSLRENVAVMIASVVARAEKCRVQLKVRIEQDVPDRLTGDGPRLILALRNLIDCAMLLLPAASPATLSNDALRDQNKVSQSEIFSELLLIISPEYESEAKIHLSFTIECISRNAGTAKTLPAASIMQLALARQIVRALADGKGKVEVSERKNSVSYTFTAAFVFNQFMPSRPRPKFVTLTGLAVLIVSENREERSALSQAMKSWRMLPREADNTTMALQLMHRMYAENSPIPLVITSNQLQSQDGFLLAFRIKQHPSLKPTAIIMLATEGKPGDAIQCRENGISAYLKQPVALLQLNEAIAAVMGAEEDTSATATLITRHSLRELKKASVLIIDSDRDQAMFAAGGLKKRDYRVVLATDSAEAYAAMGQEEFDVIVVDPEGANFAEGESVVSAISANVGRERRPPKFIMAGESPALDLSNYNGFVLKPYAKDSLVNAVSDVLPVIVVANTPA